MKNKKGVSIGRILLYVLFLSLAAVFVWVLYLTFKATREKTPTNTNQDLIKLAQNNNTAINLYDNVAYPFVNYNGGSYDSNAAWTGAFVFCEAGTYSFSYDISSLGNVNIRLLGYNMPSYTTSMYGNSLLVYNSGYLVSSPFTFTLSNDAYIGINITSFSSVNVNSVNSLHFMLNRGQPSSYVPYDSQFDYSATDYLINSYFNLYRSNDINSSIINNTFNYFSISIIRNSI